MRLRFIAFLVFLIGALFIVSNGNLHLHRSDEALTFARAYYSWIIQIARTLVHLTGSVIGASWVPPVNGTG